MKNTIYTLFVFLVVSFTAAFAQQKVDASTHPGPLKIGYVDSESIFQQFPDAIKVNGELEAYSKSLSDRLDSMTQAFQAGVADYQKQANTMTDAKKAEQEQKLGALQKQIEEFRRGAQTDLMQKREKAVKPVREKIIKAIEVIAKEEGMLFIFDKPDEAYLLYADSNFDITYKVLDKLRRGK